jgi:hypothetical protein|tara:strand:+ start:392 stop:577 length:186 start_codon:yes stop_codon:yes gene_type:complete
MKPSLKSQALSCLLIIPAAILGLAGMLTVLISFYWVCTWPRGKLRCDTERFAHNRWLVSLL